MSVKPNVTETGKAASDNTSLKCGDCMHFKGSPHPGIGQACELRGVKKFATAPNCYTANVHVFKSTAPQTLSVLAGIFSSFSPSQTRVLMGLLKTQAGLQRQGLVFLQKVYFCIGADYLENYYAGFALGVGPQKDVLIVGSQFHSNQKNPIVASLFRDSVLTRKEFQCKVDELSECGKLYETRRPRVRIPEELAGYEPPTIETPELLLEASAASSPKKQRGKGASMLEIRHERADEVV